jgi:GST-like protein
MICYPWTVNWQLQGQDFDEFPHINRWFQEIGERPAVERGMMAGADLLVDVSKLPPEEQARIRRIMYNQRATPVSAQKAPAQ